jgi:hypothetical protein
MANRATPKMYDLYKLSLLLYKTYNHQIPIKEWIQLNINQYFASQQTNFMSNIFLDSKLNLHWNKWWKWKKKRFYLPTEWGFFYHFCVLSYLWKTIRQHFKSSYYMSRIGVLKLESYVILPNLSVNHFSLLLPYTCMPFHMSHISLANRWLKIKKRIGNSRVWTRERYNQNSDVWNH